MNNPYSPPMANPNAPAYPAYVGETRVEVTDQCVDLLRQTRPWVLTLSIMSFLGSGLMLLGGLAMIGLSLVAPSGSAGAVPVALGVVYLPFSFLYIYPALKLWSFASAIARLTVSRSTSDLEAALGQQKSFWKFAGIVTISMIILYFVGIAVMMALGFATKFH